MRRFGKLSAGLFAAMFLVNGASAWAGSVADTVYHNNDGKAKIYTMTESKEDIKAGKAHTVEVVATKYNKATGSSEIIFAGSKAEAEEAGYFSTEPGEVDNIVALAEGSAMYPGFIDGHGHFHDMGPNDLYKVNLNSPLLDGTVTCIQDIIDLMKEKAAETEKGKVVEGWNYDDTMLKEMRHPTREDLDKISTDHPIYLRHISGHVAAVNTKALEIAGWPDAEGIQTEVKGDYKTATGVLIETKAMDAVNNKLNAYRLPQDTQASIARCAQTYAAAGVTTADAGATAALNVVPDYQKAIAEGNLPIRVLVHPMGIYEQALGDGVIMDGIGWAGRGQLGWKNAGTAPTITDYTDKMQMGAYLAYDWFTDGSEAKQLGDDITSYKIRKVDLQGLPGVLGEEIEVPEGLPQNRLMLGAWKILFDGSPQAYSAWMKSPGYYDWGTYKVPADDVNKGDYLSSIAPNNLSVPVLEKWLGIYHKYGQSTEIHCNGSAASEAWVAALEKAVWANPTVQDTRHTSIHAQTMELQHVARVAGNYADADELVKSPSVTDLMGAYNEAEEISKVDKAELGERMKKQNIFLSFFDNHVYFYGDRHRDIFFGPGRAMNISPTGWAEHYGIPYSFHNDTFVTPISPLRSITSAVNRLTADGKLLTGEGDNIWKTVNYAPRKEEGKTFEEIAFPTFDHRINVLQALHAVTTGPAWQNKVDDRIGSIEKGKLADFTIMEKDIFEEAKVEDGKGIATMKVAATIVDDQVVFGMLPNANPNVVTAPGVNLGYEQPEGNNAKVEEVVELDESVLGSEYAALEEEETFLGAKDFTASVAEGKNVVFSFMVKGNGKSVDKLRLYKLIGNDKHAYKYKKPDDLNDDGASGMWWISKFAKPLEALKNSSEVTLEEGETYIVSFVVRDGHDKFDANKDSGKIKDPVVFASSTKSSNSGGSDGGCTVGTNSAYELLALLLASLGVMAGRIFRRRNA